MASKFFDFPIRSNFGAYPFHLPMSAFDPPYPLRILSLSLSLSLEVGIPLDLLYNLLHCFILLFFYAGKLPDRDAEGGYKSGVTILEISFLGDIETTTKQPFFPF